MTNKYEVLGDVTVIFVVHNGREKEVLIDTEDLPVVSVADRWCLVGSHRNYGFYVYSRMRKAKCCVQMHRLVMGAKLGQVVDHLHHNTLDNRKSKLRLTSHLVNQHNRRGLNHNNTSGYLGVTMAESGRWIGKFRFQGRFVHVGTFDDPSDAGEAVRAERERLLSSIP